MQYARTYKIAAFYSICMLVIPGNAHAAAITNLDSKAHVIEANNCAITIAAGETWRMPGKVKITYQGHEIEMDETDEYAIWNDHDFGPQRRIYPGSGSYDR